MKKGQRVGAMTNLNHKQILSEFLELIEEFKGDSTPYARGYRAALREAKYRIIRLVAEQQKEGPASDGGANTAT